MTDELSMRLQIAGRAQGLKIGVWESLPDYGSMLQRAGEGWDFQIHQIEGPGQYDRVVQSLADFRFNYPNQPAATITNFSGVDTNALAQPLINAGLACLVECFVAENPNSTPANQVYYATRVCGWPAAQPMLGLGSGLTLDIYPGWETYFGPSVWAAEYLF